MSGRGHGQRGGRGNGSDQGVRKTRGRGHRRGSRGRGVQASHLGAGIQHPPEILAASYPENEQQQYAAQQDQGDGTHDAPNPEYYIIKGMRLSSALALSLYTAPFQSFGDLAPDLDSIDGEPYAEYRRLRGNVYIHPAHWLLKIDHVQTGQPAPFSKIRLIVTSLHKTAIHQDMLNTDFDRSVVADYLTRSFARWILHKRACEQRDGIKRPEAAFSINGPGQAVLPRTSCLMDNCHIDIRLTVDLPVRDGAVHATEALNILTLALPYLVNHALFTENESEQDLRHHLWCMRNQECLRSQLSTNSLVAFVANGSNLARQTDTSDLPMPSEKAVVFHSPPELEVTLINFDGRPVKGMGIKEGITAITGKNSQGKSTLLKAIQSGIYNHIAGDGRESVVSISATVKVCAEPGRSVQGIDLRPSILQELPQVEDMKNFCSDNASDLISTIATIQEMISLYRGISALLLFDEDSSAAGFLYESDPYFPNKARALSRRHVSTIIALSSYPEELGQADTIVGMQSYRPVDHTKLYHDEDTCMGPTELVANSEIESYNHFDTPTTRAFQYPSSLLTSEPSVLRGHGLGNRHDSGLGDSLSDHLEVNDNVIVPGLEQVIEEGQLRFASKFLRYCARQFADDPLLAIARVIESRSHDAFLLDHINFGNHDNGELVYARPYELIGLLNRFRGMGVKLL